MHDYFVSFWWVKRKAYGFGNTVVGVDCRICDCDAIRAIEQKLTKENDLDKVVLLNFKAMG